MRGTPLYDTAKENGLLLTAKKNLHYLSAANDRQFTLNMKESPDLLTQDEYNEICMEMLAFQERNNRLSYTDDNQGGVDSVEDKSFNLVEDSKEIEVDPLVSQNPQGGLIEPVRNLFRS